MKILMLVNWKVAYQKKEEDIKQPPDYYISGEPYWFFRYFHSVPEVDVIDIRSFPWLERFEQEKMRFYLWQTLKAIPKLKQYDLIISHGMQSAVVLSLFRRFFRTKAKHVVFEIGSFNSAATEGAALKLMQLASKSIDGFIYHTSRQLDYYKEYFPWIVKKARFIHYGADTSFFAPACGALASDRKEILCIGDRKRDWTTLLKAYEQLKKSELKDKEKLSLRLIGKGDLSTKDSTVTCLPYIPIDQLKKEIEHAAICVVPLEYFNYSFGQMTLLQQMAMEKPVIAARVPSTMDYVKEGENALFYEPGNAEELCEKLAVLLQNEQLAVRLAKNAAISVKEEFGEEKMAAEVEAFLNRIL